MISAIDAAYNIAEPDVFFLIWVSLIMDRL